MSHKSLRQDSFIAPQVTMRKMESLVNIPQEFTQNNIPSMVDFIEPKSPESSNSEG